MATGSDEVRALERVIEYVQSAVQPDWQLQQFRLFLEIAKHDSADGITQTQLGEDLGMIQAVVSRNCRMLSKYGKKGEVAGHDLIWMTPDIFESRRLNCRLTDKGKVVYAEIKTRLNQGTSKKH